jgi:uncharacterized protein involved in type VI secretion and phage assembly
MAESIFQTVQRIFETGGAGDANRFGVEVGIVTNVKDPEKCGRVKLAIPRLRQADGNPPESTWARVAQPAAGAGRGFYWIPEVGDEVLIAFEMGQAGNPYVIGALWNGKDTPPEKAYTDDNTTRMIQTRSGHQIILNDKSGEEKIVIADKSGKRTITFDVPNKKFLVECDEGDIELHAKEKIVLDCQTLEIKTKETAKLDIGSSFDLNVQSDATVTCTGNLKLKASKVKIN